LREREKGRGKKTGGGGEKKGQTKENFTQFPATGKSKCQKKMDSVMMKKGADGKKVINLR